MFQFHPRDPTLCHVKVHPAFTLQLINGLAHERSPHHARLSMQVGDYFPLVASGEATAAPALALAPRNIPPEAVPGTPGLGGGRWNKPADVWALGHTLVAMWAHRGVRLNRGGSDFFYSGTSIVTIPQ